MRYRATILAVLVILVMVLAACGGSGDATAAPSGDSGSGGDSGAASGSPEDAALGFVNALLTGGDTTAFLCSSAADAMSQYSQGVQQALEALSAAGGEITVDTSGLSATSANADADSADVTVSGSYAVTMSVAGQSTSQSADFGSTTFSMVTEGGAWKVCGIAVG